MKTNYPYYLMALVFLVACKKDVQVTKVESIYDTQMFKDIQLAAIYKDSKSFVDLVPNEDYTSLESKYQSLKDDPSFDLKTFVSDNFSDRSMASLEFKTDTTRTMYEHIEFMWDKLTREADEAVANSSRIPLPKKYVVPGGRFQEIYYWDSYFTIEGLLAAKRVDLAKDMVDNFAHLLNTIGFIPNGTRDYYKTRSQPPFFSLMVWSLAREKPEVLVEYLPQLEKEYAFFMDENGIEGNGGHLHVVNMPNGSKLNRYWDKGAEPRPEAYKEDLHLAHEKEGKAKTQLFRDLRSAAESGWDFSSRWFATKGDFGSTQTTSLLPVDLNCLMYFLESQIAKAYMMQENEEKEALYMAKAELRDMAINQYLWNSESGFYYDYDFNQKKSSPNISLAGAFPLFFGLADGPQAEKVKEVLMQQFLKEGGLVTTLEHSGQQWDAPNGWAPLQWIAVNGLLDYGYRSEAMEIMKRWLALNEKVYKNTGKMMEKYNVEDLTLLSGGGEYETQDGFGWTNGVALAFKRILDGMEPK